MGMLASFFLAVPEVMPPQHLESLARVIQASITPALLLAAVGTTLSVLSTRLGRIVDRMRSLDLRVRGYSDGPPVSDQRRDDMRVELGTLMARRRLIDWAIISCTFSALIVSLVIAVAFTGYIWRVDVGRTVALLFVAAMLAFTCALSLFLAEVVFAERKTRGAIG
jgi:hypothetical protein